MPRQTQSYLRMLFAKRGIAPQHRYGQNFLIDLNIHDLIVKTADVGAWVSHPGGPKVIEAIVSSLGLPRDALELTWRSLAEVGNLSSTSVLHVFRDTIVALLNGEGLSYEQLVTG